MAIITGEFITFYRILYNICVFTFSCFFFYFSNVMVCRNKTMVLYGGHGSEHTNRIDNRRCMYATAVAWQQEAANEHDNVDQDDDDDDEEHCTLNGAICIISSHGRVRESYSRLQFSFIQYNTPYVGGVCVSCVLCVCRDIMLYINR